MTAHERARRIDALFEIGADLDAAARSAWLQGLTDDDALVREELESLLDACDASSSFLAEPAWVPAVGGDRRPMPERIGSFRIVRELGAGGMGVVYLAEQDRPRRRVALKVLRPGLTSARSLRRFELEAEILARLHHPGIAQIYEAGTTEWGGGPQPYFAMEYVEGPDIGVYAARAELGTRERIELIAEVCEALDHAHRRGVVHRDVKPSNVLVETSGGTARIKILDFGIARVTDLDVRGTSQRTDVGQVLGTLAYMSPEQAGLDPDAIDGRADVYALGVLGYELLSGTLPLDLAGKPLHEAVRVVREVEPRPISQVAGELRGDVETILSKALEKDPERRYGSAEALAADLRRYLGHEPIVARPPSTTYRIARFARRNRTLVAGVVGIFAAVCLGLVGTTWQAVEAAGERDAAQNSLRAEQAARVTALAALDRESRASEWFRELLGRAAPEESGPEVKLVSVLDRACGELPGSLAGLPDVEADVRTTIGRTYARLGRLAEAERELRLALARRVGQDESRTMEARGHLGLVLSRLERDPDEAEGHLRAAFEYFASHPEPSGILRAEAAGVLGRAAWRRGEVEHAERLLRGALADLEASIGPRSPEVIAFQVELGRLLSAGARLDEAEAIETRALAAAREVLGPLHPTTLAAVNNLSSTLQRRGDVGRAIPLLREACDLGERVQGAGHPESLARLNNLAMALKRSGEVEEAQALYERLIPALHERLGPDHGTTLTAEANLAVLLGGRGQLAEAEELHREVYERMLASYGAGDDRTIAQLFNLAWTIGQSRRFEEALRMLEEVVRAADGNVVGDPWERWFYRRVLGSLLETMDRPADAIPHLELAAANLTRLLGPEHKTTLAAVNALARCRARLEPGSARR